MSANVFQSPIAQPQRIYTPHAQGKPAAQPSFAALTPYMGSPFPNASLPGTAFSNNIPAFQTQSNQLPAPAGYGFQNHQPAANRFYPTPSFNQATFPPMQPIRFQPNPTYALNSTPTTFSKAPASTPFSQPNATDDAPTVEPPQGDEIPYSVVKKMVKQHKMPIKQVRIVMDPNSFSNIPVAELELRDGKKFKMLLPRETDEFIHTLEAAKVPYSYESKDKQGLQRVGAWALDAVKEMFGPFVLMAGTLAAGTQAYKYWQKHQEDGTTQEAIRKARKDLESYRYSYPETLKNHEPHVREALNGFLRNEQSVVIAKGLPGIGKTHVFLALAKQIAQNDPSVMTLEIREGVGDNLRALLRDVYSGDKDKALKAIRMLNKENNGTPVKEILLYTDEIEKIPGDEMENMLVNGVQNPDSTVPGLPKLRMLATCNAWPPFINNSAVNSRISSVLITPPKPDVTSRIFVRALKDELKGKSLPADLAKTLQPIFEEYEGYNPRTLTQVVVKSVASALKETEKPDAKTIGDALKRKLEVTPLNNTEMASMIVRNITRNIMESDHPLDPVNGPSTLWRTLQDQAETQTAGINFLVSLNGKQAKAAIQESLKNYSLDYSNSVTNLLTAVEGVAHDLKSKRLAALQANSSAQTESESVKSDSVNKVQDPQLQAESKLTSEFTDFLNFQIREEEKEAQEQQREVSPAIQELRSLAQKISGLDRNSDAGKALSRATVRYREILEEDDSASPAFMTGPKRNAIFTRVLNYNPEIHTPENDFMLISDTRYGETFYYLKEMVRLLANPSASESTQSTK